MKGFRKFTRYLKTAATERLITRKYSMDRKYSQPHLILAKLPFYLYQWTAVPLYEWRLKNHDTMQKYKNILDVKSEVKHIFKVLQSKSSLITEKLSLGKLAGLPSPFGPLGLRSLVERLSLGSKNVAFLLNKVTGYDVIEHLRSEVALQDTNYRSQRQKLQEISLSHTLTVDTLLSTQKQLSDLLQRKSSWQSVDFSTFTDLLREEHLHDQSLVTLKRQLKEQTELVDLAHESLMNSLRERYQTEQAWSDKIRQLATGGTMILILVNLILFVATQIIWEPKKRRKIVQEVTKAITEASLSLNSAAQLDLKAVQQPETQQILGLLETLQERVTETQVLMSAHLKETPLQTTVWNTENLPRIARDALSSPMALLAEGILLGVVLSHISR